MAASESRLGTWPFWLAIGLLAIAQAGQFILFGPEFKAREKFETRTYDVPPQSRLIRQFASFEPDEDSPIPGFRSPEQVLGSVGVQFPAGAWANWGPGEAQLTVSNTERQLDRVEALVKYLDEERLHDVLLEFHSFALAPNDAQKLVEGAKVDWNHAEHLAEARRLVADGQGQVLAHCTGVVSGSADKVQQLRSGDVVSYTEYYEFMEDGSARPVETRLQTGASFDLEGYFESEHWVLFVNCNMELDLSPPQFRDVEVIHPTTGKVFMIRQPQFHRFHLSTAFRVGMNTARLIGASSTQRVSEESSRTQGTEKLVVVFVEATPQKL